ncbi:MAG: transcription-repair coupling factor, partial [Coriobacteriales bacterium]|nr:transcription-repair coupling factor [Coriobacteriales bacterium]
MPSPLSPSPAGLFAPLWLVAGEELAAPLSYTRLIEALLGRGYERQDRLDSLPVSEQPGTFALHGDTLDIHPAGALYPVRIEFFGETVEAIRRLVPATGQSIGTLERVSIYPARELALDPRATARAKRLLLAQTGDAAAKHGPQWARHVEMIGQGQFFNEVERYLPYLYEGPTVPLAYLHEDAMVVLVEPRSLFDDSARFYEETAASAATAMASLDGLYVAPAALDFGSRQRLTLLSLIGGGASLDARLEVKHLDTSSDERLVTNARSLVSAGFSTVLGIADRRARASAELLLSDAHIPFTTPRPPAPSPPAPCHPEPSEASVRDPWPQSGQPTQGTRAAGAPSAVASEDPSAARPCGRSARDDSVAGAPSAVASEDPSAARPCGRSARDDSVAGAPSAVASEDPSAVRPCGRSARDDSVAGAPSAVASEDPSAARPCGRSARDDSAAGAPSAPSPLLAPAPHPAPDRRPLLAPSLVTVADLEVPASLTIPSARLALLTPSGATGAAAAARRGRSRRAPDVTALTFPFKPGDYVVHATHGIALFKEILRQEVAGIERDYLYLEYAHGDKLFTPVEQIDKVTRYVGPQSATPRLTRLNTSDWSRATCKARKAAHRLAFDLVDLYARRSATQGFAYAPDNDAQYEMELVFPYEETADQLAAIADVKADMESTRPMDRLICGDVGFGKTEVALRAAFKAVQSGKQVMLLCPTTILAQQHFTTFFERFDPFAVTVEVLSRFRTGAQQKRILEGFAAGTVDVLIGTHRLLSPDVNPQGLGLMIIDEEQRFGVQHKEQLKNLREQVDVLTLSATPIPRTMQMALSGVRDMSLIDTPPASRTPIQVHVGEWDEDVVSAAIRRETQRGGQVYYVSNRVKGIDDALARVAATAPEARVGTAHGKMSAAQLEGVMESFAANEYDVLVATTIIESGLDNPHTNTLIIEDSQRLGLAQLYQLKGRVGRSHAQAYAYFLFPSESALTPEATERLTAIDEFQELGSGMRIAMRDLEIRGAGSLLGAEQHGMLSAVGFDLFASMLQEAVLAARAAGPAAGVVEEDGRRAASAASAAAPDAAGALGTPPSEVRIDLPVPFFLPEEYVAAADERVRLYRRLAAATDADAVARIEEQLLHTYGALPAPARNLVDRTLAKTLAKERGITSITLQRGRLVLEPIELAAEQAAALKTQGALYMPKSKRLTYPVQTGVPLLSAL